MIYLDTSYLIRALDPHSPEDAQLRTWITAGTPVSISAVCWAEFLCGPVTDQQVALAAQLLGEPIAFTREDAMRTAGLFKTGGRRRGSLVDCMAAAAALGAGASLATANTKDFRRFEAAGLRLER